MSITVGYSFAWFRTQYILFVSPFFIQMCAWDFFLAAVWSQSSLHLTGVPFWMLIMCQERCQVLSRVRSFTAHSPLSSRQAHPALVGGRGAQALESDVGSGPGSAVWPQADRFTSLSLCFQICKMELSVTASPKAVLLFPGSPACEPLNPAPGRGMWVLTLPVGIQRTWPWGWHTGQTGNGVGYW